MKMTNISEFKAHLSAFLAAVEQGEEIEIRKRNLPIARLVPIEKARKNGTVLGCGRGTVDVTGDLTVPLISSDDWEMLDEGSDETSS